MEYKIFYSWHSDLNQKHHRYFIWDALESVKRTLHKEWQMEAETELEQSREEVGKSATRVELSRGGAEGFAGAVNIADAIFTKIRQSDVFIADVTIINSTEFGASRPTPNPNVLIELGYAAAVLGWDRILLVVNTAYGNFENLPFDIRQRQPVPYYLPEERDSEKTEIRRKFEGGLKTALLEIFKLLPTEEPAETIQEIPTHIDRPFLQTSTHARFELVVRDLLSKKDVVNLNFIVRELSREICKLVKPEDTELSKSLTNLLDKLTCVLVAALEAGEQNLFNVGLKGLVKVYNNFFDEHGYLPPRTDNIAIRKLLLEIAVRVVAIGGYAVRLENWQAVHDLILQTPPQEHKSRSKPVLWVRKAQLFELERVAKPESFFMFTKASKIVEELECLRVDLPPDNPNIRNSLLQFDCLTALVTLVKGGNNWYPNFASHPTNHTQPIVVKLLENPDIQKILFDGTPTATNLAKFMRLIDNTAENQNSNKWMGFDDPVIDKFLRRNPEESF